MGIPIPHVFSTNTVMQVALLLLGNNESVGSDLTFSDITLEVLLGHLITALQGWRSSLPTHSCLLCVEMMFSWSSAVILKKFFLAQLSFSSFFGYRDQAFVRAIYLCLLPFPSFQFLQLQIWSIWGKKKAQGTHHCVFLCIARFLAHQPSSLYLSECYYAWFTHNVQGF